MKVTLLVDFGSTYTKLVAVDVDAGCILGVAQSPTTVQTDVMDGLERARRLLHEQLGQELDVGRYLACSSAAGGLRMVAIGLVRDLTGEAAKQAALNAGAKIVDVFAHKLSADDQARLISEGPDIILLAGGTDGGNSANILYNARELARLPVRPPIVVAGNAAVRDEVVAILEAGGQEAHATQNVLPEIGELNTGPAREVIREVFIRRVVEAKGLSRVKEVTDRIVMPTPEAVLKAAELLAAGVPGDPGLGDLMLVDVGGATTDVHSVADGRPKSRGVRLVGVGDAPVKRTVEGDLGVRVSALSLFESAGQERLSALSRLNGFDFSRACRERNDNTPMLAGDGVEVEVDITLASACVTLATERHVGHIETRYSVSGLDFVQRGKDLTQVDWVIGTGGSLVHSADPRRILQQAVYSESAPASLRPKRPRFLLDSSYVLSAMGLLAEHEPRLALALMKRHLQPLDQPEPAISVGRERCNT